MKNKKKVFFISGTPYWKGEKLNMKQKLSEYVKQINREDVWV
jgi:hypothetical protein